MPLTQENRLLSIETPLGEDVLVLTGFSGSEGISRPFSYELSLASEDQSINPSDIIGQNVTMSITLSEDEKRYINGVISGFSQEREGLVEGDQTLRVMTYSAQLVPGIWFLSRSVNFRIFQGRTVQQIVEQIFSDRSFSDYEFRLRGSYEPRDNCVQYRETDLQFISRLLEQEGILYFFEHEQGRHLLVLTDSPEEHRDCPHQDTVRCQLSGGAAVQEVDMITSLGWGQEIRFSKYTTKDYNFLMPSTDLKVEVPTRISLGQGERELYDFPGDYQTRNEGDRYANIRMQAEEARVTALSGSGTCRAFVSGYRFTLQDYYREDMNNAPYVLTEVSHAAFEAVGGSDQETPGTYSNKFTCIPFDVPFRPPMETPKPLVVGVQTAIVTGPEGEEIYTDEHGRVKVKFHWDRDPGRNEESSCWVRVAQIAAGQGWGGMWIPRIGHEVVVSFVEGDPDRPIVIGSVYNGTNMPPYRLPDEKTKSTIKSCSSIGGEGFNEIRFEDKKGEEQILIQAERNQDIRTKKDRLEWVGENSHLIVTKDLMEQVDGDMHLYVKGDRNADVDGTASLHAKTDIQEKADSNYALDAGMEVHIKAGMNLVIESGTTLTFKVGGNYININSGGVFITGSMVMLNSGGSAGSGSGVSVGTPTAPMEADKAEPPLAPSAYSPQARVMQQAAQNGAPFCDT